MSARSLAQNLPDHTLIVGGGAIGLASAWALSDQGARVTVLDAGKVGEGALKASGGMLAAGFEACFELSPTHPLADAYVAFLNHSQGLWRAWAPRLQALSATALGYDQQGSVTPAFTCADEARLDQAEALAQRFRVQAERVGAHHFAGLEPGLAPARGAMVFPGDGQLDNRALGRVLSDAIARRGGEIVEGRRVRALDRTAGRVTGVVLEDGQVLKADCVLLSTGADRFVETPDFAKMIPVKGQMIRFDVSPENAPKRVVRGLSIYLAAKSGGRLLAGASSEPGLAQLDTDPDTLERLAAAARTVMPGLAGRPIVESWAGLRPCAQDLMPIVGAAEPGLFLALGAYRNGVLTAPGMADLVLQALGARVGTASAKSFSTARFALKA